MIKATCSADLKILTPTVFSLSSFVEGLETVKDVFRHLAWQPVYATTKKKLSQVTKVCAWRMTRNDSIKTYIEKYFSNLRLLFDYLFGTRVLQDRVALQLWIFCSSSNNRVHFTLDNTSDKSLNHIFLKVQFNISNLSPNM